MSSFPRHPRLKEAVAHLATLIATPSFSREEDKTAELWLKWLRDMGAEEAERYHNNIYAVAPGFNPGRPTLMLNSHHDTVKPSPSYSRNPFEPDIEGDRIYGLGSNDAGASCVALATAYLDLRSESALPFNLILAITAAEEVMGELGMRAFLPFLAEKGLAPDMVIVGEPTGMQPAIAERGLLVLDCVTEGRAGHAARNEGINAIYRALDDIRALIAFSPPLTSEILGPVKVNVTVINAGTQHNVVPDKCTFIMDVRTTDAYSNEETVELLRQIPRWSQITPRSTRVRASVIPLTHPLVESAMALGLTPFVSPTTSDMAVMHNLPSMKIGPGKSERSHTADEFVLISEINEAIHLYRKLITTLSTKLRHKDNIDNSTDYAE